MDFDTARLATVHLVPPTPSSTDGRDLPAGVLGGFARSLHDAGVRVFLPAAGTGEFHSLTAGEVIACVCAVCAAIGRDGVVLAPVGSGLPHALEIGRAPSRRGRTPCSSCLRSTLTSATPACAMTTTR